MYNDPEYILHYKWVAPRKPRAEKVIDYRNLD